MHYMGGSTFRRRGKKQREKKHRQRRHNMTTPREHPPRHEHTAQQAEKNHKTRSRNAQTWTMTDDRRTRRRAGQRGKQKGKEGWWGKTGIELQLHRPSAQTHKTTKNTDTKQQKKKATKEKKREPTRQPRTRNNKPRRTERNKTGWGPRKQKGKKQKTDERNDERAMAKQQYLHTKTPSEPFPNHRPPRSSQNSARSDLDGSVEREREPRGKAERATLPLKEPNPIRIRTA